MKTLLRILCLVLLVSTSGLAHAAEAVLEGRDACAEESSDASGECTDECGLCFCCPLRAAPAQPLPPEAVVAAGDRVAAETKIVSAGALLADIFKPPRA